MCLCGRIPVIRDCFGRFFVLRWPPVRDCRANRPIYVLILGPKRENTPKSGLFENEGIPEGGGGFFSRTAPCRVGCAICEPDDKSNYSRSTISILSSFTRVFVSTARKTTSKYRTSLRRPIAKSGLALFMSFAASTNPLS